MDGKFDGESMKRFYFVTLFNSRTEMFVQINYAQFSLANYYDVSRFEGGIGPIKRVKSP